MDGYGTPEQVSNRIQELGHTACATTNHGNLFSHVPFAKAMRKRGLKSILGCEMYVVDDTNVQEKYQESLGVNAMGHVTLLAQSQRGYENLLALSRLSWESFYYKPRIDWPALAKYQEGLVVLSGCPMGYPTRIMLAKGEEAAYDFIKQWSSRIEQFFVEIDPSPGLDLSEQTCSKLMQIAFSLKLPLVLTADAHFPRPEDHEAQDLLLAVGMGKRLNDPSRTIKLPGYQYYCSAEELVYRAQLVAPDTHFDVWREAIANTGKIAEKCEVELPRASPLVYVGLNLNETAEERLAAWISEGLGARYSAGKIPKGQLTVYQERAQHEFEVLKSKSFCSYLLIIGDVVREMKRRGALVVTRGSAGGCLILWLIGASVTDPIQHELSFERFYDESRADPPDVDLDWERGRRDEAIAYIREKYGEANTAHIAALSQLKPKSALQDAAFAYNIPRHEFGPLSGALTSQDDDVEKQFHEVTDPKALAVLQKYPQLRIAERLVGQIRQSSIHAAGLLVSSTRLDRAVGLILGKDGQTVAAVDKRGAADLGYMKLDLLSVNSLDIVAQAVRLLGKPLTWLEDLPLDDPDALAIASSGRLAGIFQLDGASAARVLKEIHADTFDDLVAASALCRPGPGDWVDTYARHKRDNIGFAVYLDRLDGLARPVVQPTFGILIYQEQVMRLAHEMAGLPMADVQRLRKGVSDKLGTQPDKAKAQAWKTEWGTKFIAGAVQRGVAMKEAFSWWERIQSHGGYSFNRSHCVTYALIGYWMCYLKAHHPAEFYQDYLSLETDAITMKRLIREFMATGGKVCLLDPGTSQARFSCPTAGVLVGGFADLHGIGEKTSERLVHQAPFESWEDILQALPANVRQRVVATGWPANRWADIQQLILLAPWFPVPVLGSEEYAYRVHYQTPTIDELPEDTLDGDVCICGYVTATDFKRERVMFGLEDETGAILCRVPNRQIANLGPDFKDLKVGDFALVKGWWCGNVMYVKARVVLKARPGNETVKSLPLQEETNE